MRGRPAAAWRSWTWTSAASPPSGSGRGAATPWPTLLATHPRSRRADDRRGRHLCRVRSRRRRRRARCRAGEDACATAASCSATPCASTANATPAWPARRRRWGCRSCRRGGQERRPVLPRHRRRLQPARTRPRPRAPRVSQRRAGFRRHPPARAAAGALRRGRLSEPRRSPPWRPMTGTRDVALRSENANTSTLILDGHAVAARRQEQPARALPRQEAHLPLRLGGRRDAAPRGRRGRSGTRW